MEGPGKYATGVGAIGAGVEAAGLAAVEGAVIGAGVATFVSAELPALDDFAVITAALGLCFEAA